MKKILVYVVGAIFFMILGFAVCYFFLQSRTVTGNETVEEIVVEAAIVEEIEVDAEETAITIYYFYYNACGSCDGEEDIDYIEEQELTDSTVDYEIDPYNTFTVEGKKFYESIKTTYGLTDLEDSFPLAIINGNVLQGLTAIESRISEQLLVSAEEVALNIDVTYQNSLTEEELFSEYTIEEMDNTLLYFYRITCSECEAVTDTVNGIPDTIALDGVEYETNLLKFNTRSAKNGDRIYRLFEVYEVAEEDQIVPIIFFADTYIAGADNINAYLNEYMENGEGIGMILP